MVFLVSASLTERAAIGIWVINQVPSAEYIFFHSRSSFFSKPEVKLILPQVFHASHFKNPKRKREKN